MTALPVAATFGPNEELAETKLNTGVRDVLNFLMDPPKALLRSDTNQSIPNATATAADFEVEDADSAGGHSNAVNPSRYTAVYPGMYELSGGYGFASNGTGYRSCTWRKNGSAIASSGVNYGAITGVATIFAAKTFQIHLNAGDYVEMWVFQNCGVALNSTGGSGTSTDRPVMVVKWISSTGD